MPADVELDRAPPLARPADGRWRTWALLASLVANLFLGGVLLGRNLAPAQPAAPVGSGARAGGGGMAARARSLPTAERLKFMAVFARHRAEIRAARAELHLKGDLSRAAMTANPYDRARAEAAFADVRAASARLQAALQTALADAAADLSPEARGQLAQRPL